MGGQMDAGQLDTSTLRCVHSQPSSLQGPLPSVVKSELDSGRAFASHIQGLNTGKEEEGRMRWA